VDAEQSSIDFRNKLAALTETVKTNGRSLSENTQKGRDNRTAILDLITAAQRRGDAVARQTGSERAGTKAFRDSIPQIVAQAKKLGLNEAQVKALIDRISKLKPKTVPVSADVRARNVTSVTASGRVTAPSGQVIVPGRAFGGPIPGQLDGDRSDSRLIAATPGEYMIQRPVVRNLEKWAPGFLDALNAGKIGLGGDPDTTEFVKGSKRFGYAAGGLIQSVQQHITAQRGEPYVWGGTGPFGADCSGLVGQAYGLLTGRSPYSRYFTTDTIGAAQGFRPGLGTFSVGVTPGRGHMAGNIAGLPFEATPPRIKVGASAAPVTSFARRYHLPQIGGQFMGHGDGAPLGFDGKQLKGIAQALLPYVSESIMQQLVYDEGGYLPPGANNRTGKPEPVFTDDQWGVLKQLVSAGTAPVTISIDGRVLDERVDYRVERANGHTAWQASRGRRM
jgi:hypothetical protein